MPCHPPSRSLLQFRRSLHVAVFLLLTTVVFPADDIPGLSTPGAEPNKEVVKLTPFEVSSDKDTGYSALNSNSLTLVNAELNKLPLSADIFDSAFMQDVAATSVEAMIQTYSAGAGASFGDPSSNLTQPGDRLPNGFVSLRGVSAPIVRRDGFLPLNTYQTASTTSTGSSSNFDFERVEVLLGPQALLYGNSGAGGAINLVSKQARLGQPAFGSLEYQVDQFGGKLAQLDYGMGTDNFAVRVALIDQHTATHRIDIGGNLMGAYLQVAGKVFGNTVIRLYGEETYNRFYEPAQLTFSAASTANDARNGQPLHYLLATNQLAAAANGAPSGGGYIGNGLINWDNIDSFLGSFWQEEVRNNLGVLTADTKWNSWLSSTVSVGYRIWKDWNSDPGQTYYAPNNPTNPFPGEPSIGLTSSQPLQEQDIPARTKAIRAALLMENSLFGGSAKSSTVFGGDFTRTDSALIYYDWFQADSNWNVITTPGVGGIFAGRTIIPAQGWSVAKGIVKYPLGFSPFDSRITINGVNYEKMLLNPVDPSLIGPNDPLGVTIAGGNHYVVKDLNQGFFVMNSTEWFHQRLETLVGARLLNLFKATEYQGVAPTAQSPSSFTTKIAQGHDKLAFDLGVNFALTSWLRPYIAFSSAYNAPGGQSYDPLGNVPVSGRSLEEEAGVKIQNARATISGSLAVYHVSGKNEPQFITAILVTDINPAGLNGKYGAPSTLISVDRVTNGVQATLTAQPAPGWRLRFSSAFQDGTIGSNVSFGQLYNDQFHENSSGQVTYADGSVVYVPATYNSKALTATSTTAGAVPLTVGLMNDPNSSYYANPVAVTGQISSGSGVAKVLAVVDPLHGPILTGVTGLPISAIQINPGATPPGNIILAQSGQKSVGFPEFSANMTSIYTFSRGWPRGVRLGGTVSGSWVTNKYYYYPNGLGTTGLNATRKLFRMPDLNRFDLIAGYVHKLGRYMFSTQLNVSNIFNHYHIVILPNAAVGYSAPIQATFDQQPRTYVWTNTLSF